MEKALKYVNTYKPMQINDLESQRILWDRRKVYQILKANDIPLTRHFFINRKNDKAIDQGFLEDFAKANKGREEDIIRHAQEMKAKFEAESSHSDKDQ